MPARGLEPRRRAQGLRRNPRHRLQHLGRMGLLPNETCPILIFIPVAALADERLVSQPFGDDDMRHRRQHCDIGAGLQGQVMRGFDMRRAHQIDPARVDDDELCALTKMKASSAPTA